MISTRSSLPKQAEVGIHIYRDHTDKATIDMVAVAAEEMGYHSIWLGDHTFAVDAVNSRHPFSKGGVPSHSLSTAWSDSLITLSYLARATNRVRLGTSVIPVINRHPLTLAKQAATVDMLSGGRLELGVGGGWLLEEAKALDLPYDHRAERLRETLEIARLAWTRNSFAFSGRFWRFEEVGVHPHPPQGKSLPVWIGGTSSSALRTTADYAMGNIVASSTPEQVNEIRGRLDGVKAGLRLASLIAMTASVDELSDRASAHVEAGADLVILQTMGSRDEIRRVIEDFASKNLRRP